VSHPCVVAVSARPEAIDVPPLHGPVAVAANHSDAVASLSSSSRLKLAVNVAFFAIVVSDASVAKLAVGAALTVGTGVGVDVGVAVGAGVGVAVGTGVGVDVGVGVDAVVGVAVACGSVKVSSSVDGSLLMFPALSMPHKRSVLRPAPALDSRKARG
jgi:hypothetical protein